MSLSGGIELAPLIAKIKVNIKDFKNDMEQVKTEAVAKTKEVSKQMEKTIKVGENMSKIGGTLTKSLTVPIAGTGVAITKMAIDFESSFAKVSTLLDKNVVDYDQYKNDLLKASDDSKTAVGEFSEAVYGSISAGVDQTKAIKFTTDAIKLAKGGFTDAAKAVDVMTTAINGYNMSADDATKISDMLITTQNLGKTTVDELASSMGTVIPVAASVNFGMDELSASYAQLTKNGIATAESGTYLKSMLSELGKSGSVTDGVLRELTGKGFADLKKEGKSTSEILNMLSDYAEQNGKTLKDMFGSVEAGSAALVLAKGDGEEYNSMLAAMKDSAGATQEAFEKMDATPAEKLKGSLNELKNAGIKLGTSLIPVVTNFAESLTKLVDGFNKLTPEQQENIIKYGLMAAAIGPVLKLTGGLVQSYGKLKPAISGVTTLLKKGAPVVGKYGLKLAESGGLIGKFGGWLGNLTKVGPAATTALTTVAGGAQVAGGAVATAGASAGGLLSTLGGMAVAAAPWVAGAAAVTAAGYGIYKCLSKDVIPEVDLFADKVETSSITIQDAYGNTVNSVTKNVVKISEATQQGVQSYLDMDNEVTRSMYEMKVNSTTITSQIADDMIGKFSAMGDSIITKQKETVSTSLNTISSFFHESDGVIDEGEQAILDNVKAKQEEQIKTIEKAKADIAEIYKRAAAENRTITEAEQAQINEIQEQMRDTAITTFSETEQEAAVIRERMKDYQGRLSAEMASEMIAKANEARDKEKQAATDKYEGIVKEASKLKQAGLITDEEYQSMVDAAEKARDEQIKRANEACDGVKDEIQNATPGIAAQVNMQTGEIKSTWNRLCDWVSDQFDWLTGKANAAQRMAKEAKSSGSGLQKTRGYNYNGLDYVPFDGYNARLHEGEAVLTKKENEAYRETKANGSGAGQVINFNGNYSFGDRNDIDYFMNQAALRLKAVR